MDSDSDAPPLCNACNHHHFQGTKCSICGHVGQSNLYVRMCEKAIALSNYRVERLPHSLSEGADMYAVSAELRRQVLCTEGSSTDIDEFEGCSRCLVGYLGDLPIWTARWRITHLDCAALIDRMAILPEYNLQHIFSSSMDHVLADIENHCCEGSSTAVSHILVCVPLHEGAGVGGGKGWMGGTLEEMGWSTQNKTAQCVINGVSFYHAMLRR